MISLTTCTAPACLDKYSKLDPIPAFDALAFQTCKKSTRTILLENQHYQCGYCETPLVNNGESTHIDHIEPQGDNGGNPKRRFDITNLIASCQVKGCCGDQRKQNPLPDTLNPYIAANLDEAFHCSSSGELSNSNLASEAFKYAEQNLNLNCLALKTQRATVIFKLRQHTIALGANARKKIKNLSTKDTGFISLHYQVLGKHGFPKP